MISCPTPNYGGHVVTSSFQAFYSSLSGLCGQGLLGPLPHELRHPFIFLGLFVLLVCLPLLMRNARQWRWLLAALPIWWLGIALLTAGFRTAGQNELPDMVGNIAMLLLLPYGGLGLTAIVLNKGYRLGTAGLIAANFYAALFVTFICAMAVTGNWI